MVRSFALVMAVVCVAASCGVDRRSDAPADAGLLSVMPSGTTIRSGGSFGLDRTQVLVNGGEPFHRVLRVSFPAGSGSERSADQDETPKGGAQAYLRYREAADEANLRYYVRFPQGFDFVKGGKLPGLYGGTHTSGRKIPDGTNGFSTRYMWRRNGAGEIYAYLPTSTDHGTSLGRANWRFVPGEWICLEQRVELNTPGRSDGRVTVWLDGQTVLDQRNLTFRTAPSLQIEGIFFSSFFGGGDKSWSTPVDQQVDFADFRMASGYIGPAL